MVKLFKFNGSIVKQTTAIGLHLQGSVRWFDLSDASKPDIDPELAADMENLANGNDLTELQETGHIETIRPTVRRRKEG